MANLKLIKVTGSPFCSTLYGCIGIQTGNTVFEVIKGGGLNTQSSSSGFGWEYATAEEIAENWKLIYPHWTPEPGDNVIVTQDYDDWVNQRGTIYDKGTSKDYWRVKREDGQTQSFDYTCQMILAPTTSSTSVIETKSESSNGWKWQDLKVGDNVKIIRGDSSYRPIGSIFTIDRMEYKDYGGKQPIKLIGSDGEDKGWPYIGTFEPYYGDVKPSKSSEPFEPEKETMRKFKIGDRVKCINSDIRGYGKIGTILAQSTDTSDTSVGVEFDEDIDGHTLDGRCPMDRGWWIFEKDLELASDSKPKPKSSFELGDYVKALEGPFVAQVGVIRELKGGRFGVEFPEKSRNGGHDLNGKCKDGYGWYYGSTEIVPASSSASIGVVESTFSVDSQPKRRFKVGDKVTYKSMSECGGKYHFGGDEQQGIVGTVKSEGSFLNLKEKGCYTMQVTTKSGSTYTMLESEFKEYEGGTHAVSQDPIPIRRFYVGKPVTYKSIDDCGGYYRFGGVNRGGRVGEIEAYLEYDFDYKCYKITVSSGTPSDCSYSMLESEFEEFDPSYSGTIHVPECSTAAVLTIPTGSTTFGTGSTSSDPLDVYKQTPITIKKKPKTKLTITTI